LLQPSPLKRNLIPRFMKGGVAQETMIDALTVYQEGYRDSLKEKNFLAVHATLPSMRRRHSTL
jgi:hypothetical protein